MPTSTSATATRWPPGPCRPRRLRPSRATTQRPSRSRPRTCRSTTRTPLSARQQRLPSEQERRSEGALRETWWEYVVEKGRCRPRSEVRPPAERGVASDLLRHRRALSFACLYRIPFPSLVRPRRGSARGSVDSAITSGWEGERQAYYRPLRRPSEPESCECSEFVSLHTFGQSERIVSIES